MNGVWLRIRLGVCAVLLAGCVNPQNTRLPTLGWGDPRVERQSYAYHDPSPERETGPFIERPRGFERQRAEPRRTLERYDQTFSPTNFGAAPTSSRYPAVVAP